MRPMPNSAGDEKYYDHSNVISALQPVDLARASSLPRSCFCALRSRLPVACRRTERRMGLDPRRAEPLSHVRRLEEVTRTVWISPTVSRGRSLQGRTKEGTIL